MQRLTLPGKPRRHRPARGNGHSAHWVYRCDTTPLRKKHCAVTYIQPLFHASVAFVKKVGGNQRWYSHQKYVVSETARSQSTGAKLKMRQRKSRSGVDLQKKWKEQAVKYTRVNKHWVYKMYRNWDSFIHSFIHSSPAQQLVQSLPPFCQCSKLTSINYLFPATLHPSPLPPLKTGITYHIYCRTESCVVTNHSVKQTPLFNKQFWYTRPPLV